MARAKQRSNPVADAEVGREPPDESRNEALVAWLEEFPDEADPTRPGASLSIVASPRNASDRPGRLATSD